jgi:hypothetical protein
LLVKANGTPSTLSKAQVMDAALLTDCTAIPALSEGDGKTHLSETLGRLFARYHLLLSHAPTMD